MKLHAYKEGVHATAQRETNPTRRSRIYRSAAERIAGLIRERRHSRDARDVQAVRAMQELAREFADLAKVRPTVEDFEELLEITAEAYNEVGEDDDDSPELARIARAGQISEERDETQRFTISPDSFRNARLGDIATLKWDPTSDELTAGLKQSTTVVLWQGQKVEAQAMTVDVDVLSRPAFDTSGTLIPQTSAYVEVQYGIDGFKSQTVRADVGRGTRFTVPANYLSVLLGMRTPRTVSGGVSMPMTIGAGVGAFSAPSVAPVMYTEYTGTFYTTYAPTDNSVIVAVPNKAAFLLPPQCDNSNVFATYTFLGYSELDVLNVLQFGTGQGGTIPLTNDVQYIKITFEYGTDPTVTAAFSLPFQLSL